MPQPNPKPIGLMIFSLDRIPSNNLSLHQHRKEVKQRMAKMKKKKGGKKKGGMAY